MKTYIVTGKDGIDISSELSRTGAVTELRVLSNCYILKSDESLASIENIDGVLSVREEAIGSLDLEDKHNE